MVVSMQPLINRSITAVRFFTWEGNWVVGLLLFVLYIHKVSILLVCLHLLWDMDFRKAPPPWDYKTSTCLRSGQENLIRSRHKFNMSSLPTTHVTNILRFDLLRFIR